MASDPEARDHWVYRCYAEDGRLLYVGITWQALHRQSEHRVASDWSWEVATIQVEHLPTRADALERERELIQTLRPPHNRLGAIPALDDGEMTVRQVADLLGFSMEWVYQQCKSGAMGSVIKPVGRREIRVIPRAAYDEFIAEPQPDNSR
jgi:predicted GIY-YIG superfamily endonuclease